MFNLLLILILLWIRWGAIDVVIFYWAPFTINASKAIDIIDPCDEMKLLLKA